MQRNRNQRDQQRSRQDHQTCRFCNRTMSTRDLPRQQRQQQEFPDFNQIFGPGSSFQRSMSQMAQQMNQMFNFQMSINNQNMGIHMRSNQPYQQTIQISTNNGRTTQVITNGVQIRLQMDDFDDDESSYEEQQYQPPPPQRGMRRTEIRDIPVISYKPSGEKQSCAICITDFKRNDKVRILNCAHKFHDECSAEWLKRKAECPVCRTDQI
ncbi:hypothetical protein pb186bvf_013765 [Paramecium bursaria]